MLMDIISAILIVAPLLAPIALLGSLGIDPVHFGIMFIVNLELGYLTPPWASICSFPPRSLGEESFK